MPHRQLNVDLDELVAAMDSHFDGMSEWFLDTQTGEIHLIEASLLREEEDDDDDGGRDEIDDDDALPEWQREVRELAERVRTDGERYVGIPQTESHEAYRVMEDFIGRLPDARIQERLERAIAGKGTFRRFKGALLDYPRVREEWFQYEATVKRQWAADWLATLGIESTWKPQSAGCDNTG